MISLKQTDEIKDNLHLCILYNEIKDLSDLQLSDNEINYVRNRIEAKKEIIVVNQYERFLFFVQKPMEDDIPKKAEKLRRLGFELQKLVEEFEISELQFENHTPTSANVLDLIEGLILSAYQFTTYKTEKKKYKLKTIFIFDFSLEKLQLKELQYLCEAVYMARNLVNEPVITLTAVELGKEIEKMGKEAGFDVDVFSKSKIKNLKMGGLLAINEGSLNDPAFIHLSYKPKNAINEKPYVLIGKGVVYDTGGYSLKPADSLDWMKCDMAGAAAVASTFYAVSKNKLPIYLEGFIPSTDNRIDGNAVVPGDIITMYDQKTVEIINTDAEGRLILADALAYSAQFDPLLCIDLATLTGSAMRAIGKEGAVMMGTASGEMKKDLIRAGYLMHERLVEFPLWDEYDEQTKSDIADLKNLGGPEAGAITAAKFMQHFTSFPWIHLDIAGTAFYKTNDNYRGKNGTGFGVRLLYKFLKNRIL